MRYNKAFDIHLYVGYNSEGYKIILIIKRGFTMRIGFGCDHAAIGRAVVAGDVDYGVLMCGTGIGISIAANKVPGVIAAVCSEPYSAKLTKQHNNANIIAFGARVVGVELAKMILDEFFAAEFEGGRHQRRVDMIREIENR